MDDVAAIALLLVGLPALFTVSAAYMDWTDHFRLMGRRFFGMLGIVCGLGAALGIMALAFIIAGWGPS